MATVTSYTKAKIDDLIGSGGGGGGSRSAVAIPTGDDLNDYISPGLFYTAAGTGGNQPGNWPSGIGLGTLEVTTFGSIVIQLVRTTNPSGAVMYRNSLANGWTDWKRIDAGGARVAEGLSSSQNLNDVITPGLYFTGGGVGNRPTNWPEDAGIGHLEVILFGVIITQLVRTTSPSGDTFFRNSLSGGWGAWKKISAVGNDLPAISAGENLDNYDKTGRWSVWSGTPANQPANYPEGAALGVVEVIRFGNVPMQIVIDSGGRYFHRTKFSAAWGAWRRIDSEGGSAPIVEGGGESPTALKVAPIALSASTGDTTETVASGSIRFPVKLAPKITRWRLHIRNHNDRMDKTYNSGASFTGLWVGPTLSDEDPWRFAVAPTKVVGAFSLPANGDEYVSPWSNVPIGDGQISALALGWTGASGPNVSSPAGCYRSPTAAYAASVGNVQEFLNGRSNYAPFSWWIEAQVEADTPLVAMWGDSITTGTGNDLILHDSQLSQYCRKIGAIPIHHSFPGTGMVAWTNAGHHQWTRWTHLSRVDAVIHFMGQNDLHPDQTLQGMKDRFNNTIDHLKRFVSSNVYLATLTPHSGKSAAVNTVRKNYNNWLQTLPGGALDCFDFSAAVQNATNDAMLAQYTSDTLHLNTLGSTKVAEAITRPVTTEKPYETPGWLTLTHPNILSGIVQIKRSGSTVELIILASEINAQTLAGVIPQGYRPPLETNGKTDPYFSTNPEIPYRILPNGDFTLRTLPTVGDAIRLTRVWFTDEPRPTL